MQNDSNSDGILLVRAGGLTLLDDTVRLIEKRDHKGSNTQGTVKGKVVTKMPSSGARAAHVAAGSNIGRCLARCSTAVGESPVVCSSRQLRSGGLRRDFRAGVYLRTVFHVSRTCSLLLEGFVMLCSAGALSSELLEAHKKFSTPSGLPSRPDQAQTEETAIPDGGMARCVGSSVPAVRAVFPPAYEIALDHSDTRSQHRVWIDSFLNRNLRPHQREGVQWMYNQLLSGGGCILADTMGLGKTLQALCLVWVAVSPFGSRRPLATKCVVACPSSLVGNWSHGT